MAEKEKPNTDEVVEELETEEVDENADATDQDNEGENHDESGDHASNNDNEIDYKERLADEERRGKPDPEKARERFTQAEAKRKEDDQEGEKPVAFTSDEIDRIITQHFNAFTKQQNVVRISEIASTLSDNEDERKLIVAIHQNRTWPSNMSLEQQLQEAQYIANGPRMSARHNELKRALVNKKQVNTNAAGTHRDAPQAGEPKVSSDVRKVLLQSKFTWNGSKARYEKKLPNGKFLVYDVKARNTRLANV